MFLQLKFQPLLLIVLRRLVLLLILLLLLLLLLLPPLLLLCFCFSASAIKIIEPAWENATHSCAGLDAMPTTGGPKRTGRATNGISRAGSSATPRYRMWSPPQVKHARVNRTRCTPCTICIYSKSEMMQHRFQHYDARTQTVKKRNRCWHLELLGPNR